MLYLLAVLFASWQLTKRVFQPCLAVTLAVIYAVSYLMVYRTSQGMRAQAEMLKAKIVERTIKHILATSHAAIAIGLYTYDWSSLQWTF